MEMKKYLDQLSSEEAEFEVEIPPLTPPQTARTDETETTETTPTSTRSESGLEASSPEEDRETGYNEPPSPDAGQYLAFETFNFSGTNGYFPSSGGYFPSPPPRYIPLPENQDFGLNMMPPGYYGPVDGMFGYNPIPVPPQPYAPNMMYMKVIPAMKPNPPTPMIPYYPPPRVDENGRPAIFAPFGASTGIYGGPSFGGMPMDFRSFSGPSGYFPSPLPTYMPFPENQDYVFGFMPPEYMPPSGSQDFGLGSVQPVVERITPESDFIGLNTVANSKLPYVSNVMDVNIIAHMKPTPPKFAYYVPPRVDDSDFFGGQLRIWQEKMMNCFSLFIPDIWNLQGLLDFNKPKEEGYTHFTMTCKLRFCCRRCHRPWTSMRGKVHFAFRLDTIQRRGLILMKIFGQVCNHDGCNDPKFQMPACYPEEIDRVLWKLFEYVGYTSYRIPLSRKFLCDSDMSIRAGNPKSPHRPALCQACQQGICSKAK